MEVAMAEQSSPTHDVFLSYSSRDKAWADAACSVLERHRVRCWIAPRDITPGEEWGAAIIKGISRSRILEVIFSGHANSSAQVRREVERAISRGMSVLPVRIENVLPDGAMEFALGNMHWLDAFTPPVERQLELLARSVKTLVGNDVPRPAEAAEPTRPPFSQRAKLWYHQNRTAVRIAVAAGVISACILAVLGTVLLSRPRRSVEKTPERSVQTGPGRTVRAELGRFPPGAAEAAATDGFIPLFNGKDTSGWRLENSPHCWEVVGGLLEGTSGPSPLAIYTVRADFANFRLRVETMMPDGLNGFVSFRRSEANVWNGHGYLVCIGGTRQARNESRNIGDLLFLSGRPPLVTLDEADPIVPIKPGEWFVLEVIADGDLIRVIIRGVEVVKFRILHRKLTSGAIGLGCDRNSKVVFRKIEIKELDGPGKSAGAGRRPASLTSNRFPMVSTAIWTSLLDDAVDCDRAGSPWHCRLTIDFAGEAIRLRAFRAFAAVSCLATLFACGAEFCRGVDDRRIRH
jgi:hypothetical protein